MFSLKISESKRILSATYPQYDPEGIIVDSLPDGDISDYKYIDGQYVYDPIPAPPTPEPAPSLESRLTDLELAIADLYGGAL